MLSTGRGQSRVNGVTNTAMCRATHVLRVIWRVECDGNTHFHIWAKINSSSGQNVKFLYPKFSFLKPKFSQVKNMTFLSNFVSKLKRDFFWCATIRNAKNSLLKKRLHHLWGEVRQDATENAFCRIFFFVLRYQPCQRIYGNVLWTFFYIFPSWANSLLSTSYACGEWFPRWL